MYASAKAAALDSVAADSSQEGHQSIRMYLTFLYDPGFTMRSGTENILALHHGIAQTEDALLGTRWFSEDTFVKKSGGALARFAKYAILDMPLDYFSVVLAHEYFGHGARYRELDIENVHYAFDLPPPYGKGDGEASVSISGNTVSYHELLGIWQGGIEAHPMINQRLGLRWMATKEMHYREAMVYFWSWQTMFSYIQEATNDLTAAVSDTDPRAYIRILNRDNGYTDPSNPRLTVKGLKSRVALSLANPFIFFALYTGLKTYLRDGNTSFELSTIRFGEVNYLPLLRTGLTPFGPEYHLENYFRLGKNILLIDLRMGDQTFHTSWGGIGVAFQNVYSRGRFSTDAVIDLWRQPTLKLGGVPGVSKGGGIGGAFSVRGYYDFTDANRSLSAVLELGYKSVGFLEGYRFDASPVFRIGMGIWP